ncbi:MAG TPA: ATP-binding protein [Planctomycetota bacterium]|nr:ATP-binding protein [Planctomycetota bacterium]
MGVPLFSRVRTRLLLLVLLAVVPALALLCVAAAEQRQIERDHATAEVERLARATAAAKEQLVESTRQLLATLAQVDAVRRADPAPCGRLFEALIREHPAYANFGLAAPDGRFLASALPGWETKNAADRTWFLRAVLSRAFATGDYQIGRITHKATVNFAQPILDDEGRLVSVIFAALDLEWFGRVQGDVAMPPEAVVVITDRHGTVLSRRPDPGNLAGHPFPDHAALVAAAEAGPRRVRGSDGVERIYSCVRLGTASEPSGYLAVGLDEKSAVAAAERAFLFHLIGLGIVAVVTLLAAWFGGDVFLLRRVRALLGATRKVREGDLSARCAAHGGGGELDELATAFNETAEALQRREEEQRRALGARREAEGRYRSLVDLSPDAILVEREGVVVFANAAAGALLAASDPGALVGKRFLDLCPPDTRTEVEARLRDVHDGRSAAPREQRLARLDGSALHVEIAATRFVHDGGAASLLLVRDISARLLLEEQLRRSQKLEAVGQLAGGVAHDFNNLLTVILGYCQLLRAESKGTNPFLQELEEIQRAAESAARLTSQLLAFSRKQVTQPTLVDLNETLTGLDRMLRRLLREDIELCTAPGEGVAYVRIDPGHLEQLIVNLVVNARDAMPDGGRLTLETADAMLDDAYAATHEGVRPGRYSMFAITDTGIGMDAETRRRMFEPFFTTKGPGRGTGLGLSTVYGIVKQAGGHIWLYSEPGRGTTFKIYLPAATRSPRATVPPLVAESAPGGSETILLVEDEDAVRKLALQALRSRGYEVIETRNGQEALAIAARGRGTIGLVVSDVVMPQMGGPDLVARLKATQPGLRAILMSGYADNAMKEANLRTDDVAFLGKPFTLDALVRKVREVLDTPTGAHAAN